MKNLKMNLMKKTTIIVIIIVEIEGSSIVLGFGS